jgi:hypothetical protein
MEFLKNHYEKVVLGLVLLGLAAAVALLPMKVQSNAEEPGTPAPNPLAPLDTRTNELALLSLENLKPVVLSGTNNTFNPVIWRRRADGFLQKFDANTPMIVITRPPAPLFTTLSLENVIGSNYVIGLLQEAHKNPSARGKKIYYAAPSEKMAFFQIREVKGPVENPAELVVELSDSREQVSLSKDRPYKRVDGYTAELKYLPENRILGVKRAGDNLIVEGETNNVVEISSNLVVLSDSSGTRKTISYQSAP